MRLTVTLSGFVPGSDCTKRLPNVIPLASFVVEHRLTENRTKEYHSYLLTAVAERSRCPVLSAFIQTHVRLGCRGIIP